MAYKARWIVYLHSPFPGSFDVVHASSIKHAREYLKAYAKDTGFTNPTASLYAYTEEMWEEAMDFKDTGCPFDYPAYVMEFGPKGGIQVERC